VSEQTVRAFVAVELTPEVKALLGQVARDLQAQGATRAMKWVDPAQVHITVKFLGDVPPAQVAQVRAALEAIGARHAPFALRLGGLGVFPSAARTRVVWASLAEGAGPLVGLIDDAERALNALGFKPERRDPSPHVTLARVKDYATPQERRALADLLAQAAVPAFPPVTVDHVTLMRSTLTPQGALYAPLALARLAQPAA
jgi:2'-5' RNA ligase